MVEECIGLGVVPSVMGIGVASTVEADSVVTVSLVYQIVESGTAELDVVVLVILAEMSMRIVFENIVG